ncbi:MAG TPA: hypothetical protein DHU59_07755 [Clostridiales bacterium]|nr:hypothetical protein [Clostridiales bacterium]
MSKIKVADFYYGAVLSMLFNQHINPALVECNDDRQIYDLTTNHGSSRLYIKYRASKNKTKNEAYNSWQFVFALNEIDEIKKYMDNNYNLSMALVCGVDGLSDSEIAVLDKNEIKELMKLGKTSITISRKKNERAYRISTGGGRNSAMQVKANRFEDIFTNN